MDVSSFYRKESVLLIEEKRSRLSGLAPCAQAGNHDLLYLGAIGFLSALPDRKAAQVPMAR